MFERFVELDDKFHAECSKQGLTNYDGPIGNFFYETLPDKFRQNANKRYDTCWVPAVNRLEIIAAAFVSGVADERLGFTIIGWNFCVTIAAKYDILCIVRGEDKTHPVYQTIVDLYQLWTPRLSKAQLLHARQEIEKRLAATIDKTIRPIGVE